MVKEVKSTGIKTWPEDDRPREKLLGKGARSLSNSELLAIFLRTGTNGSSAIDLARTGRPLGGKNFITKIEIVDSGC